MELITLLQLAENVIEKNGYMRLKKKEHQGCYGVVVRQWLK